LIKVNTNTRHWSIKEFVISYSVYQCAFACSTVPNDSHLYDFFFLPIHIILLYNIITNILLLLPILLSIYITTIAIWFIHLIIIIISKNVFLFEICLCLIVPFLQQFLYIYIIIDRRLEIINILQFSNLFNLLYQICISLYLNITFTTHKNNMFLLY